MEWNKRMSNIRSQIEEKFENLGRIIYKNPIKTLLLLFTLIAALAIHIPKLTIDTSTEGILHKNDPLLMEYNDYRDQFNGSTIILLGIQSPEIFTPEFLKKLENLHRDLENEVPYLHKVTSLINVRNTRGEGDILYADGLLEGWQDSSVDLAKIKKLALENLFYENSILSEDGRLAAIVIETDASIEESDEVEDFLEGFDEEAPEPQQNPQAPKKRYFSEKDNAAVITAIEQIVARYQAPDMQIYLTGRPVAIHTLNVELEKDMSLLRRVAASMVAFFLFILFRRFSGVVLPFVPIFSAISSTFGLMALCNASITLFTTILPSFIIAVGVADSIHILAIFYRRFQQRYNKEDAISYALGHSGLAIVLTSLTTAAGLLSFSFSEIAALGEMGMFSAAGVMFALIYSVLMLPAMFALIPLKRIETISMRKQTAIMDRVLLFFVNFSIQHRKKVIVVGLIIGIVSAYGVSMLEFSQNMLRYFPDTLKVKQDTVHIDDKLKGTLVLRVVVDTGKENGLYASEILNSVDRFIEKIKKIRMDELYVGKVISINNILKETNKALHGNDDSHYTIPKDRRLIAQEFLLFENTGSDDLEDIVDSQFSKTSMTVKIPYVDYALIDNFMDRLISEFGRIFHGSSKIIITGIPALMGRTIPMAQDSMIISYALALIIISLMMVFLLGSFKIGLLCMVPNVLPIMAVMGAMGYFNVAVDMSALMIGSIAIGLVVDDTMHFMYNFRKYHAHSGNVYGALKETMLGTGRALLITSLVLCSFFFSVILGTLNNTVIFGLYTGLVIIVALLADFILLPALLAVVSRKQEINVV